MSKFCPDCGTPTNGAKFCAECGFRFQVAGADAAAGSVAAAAPALTSSRWQNNGSFNGSGAAAAAGRWQNNGSFNSTNNANGNANVNANANGNGSGNDNASLFTPNNMAQAAQVAAAAAPLAARASSYAAQNSGIYGRTQPSPQPPMAVAAPVHGGGGSATFANTYNTPGSDPLLYKPAFPAATPVPNATTQNPSPSPSVSPSLPLPEPVPPAAAGAEAQQVYEQCVQTMRQSRGGQNENGVKAFKQNCRLYGLNQMAVVAFYDSLVRELGPEATLAFVPNLARLVPDDDRRKELIEYNASKRPATYGTPPFLNRNSSSSSTGSYRDRAGSQPGAAPASKGLLKGRYADHPNCDICNVAFDVTKRRHHCRHCGLSICSSCSPLRLLIPQGMEVANAKGYDVSLPQRVCIQCAPKLHEFQDQLVAQFAKANEDNAYQAQGRLVHVPFSNSLFKECQNAADIIGNFFRDDWGAAADRAIPTAFLQKAHGLAILTIIKAGFLITGQIGTGLVVAKLPDGTWSAPSAIGLFGLSGGFEIGGELIELMIILGSEGAVKVFHKPQANIGAGLDLAVGPYGRSAAATAAVSSSGLNANYSYSHSKGLFAGISLQGKLIASRNDLNRKFYGRDLQPSEILSGHVAAPNAARPLYEAIQHAMEGVENHRESVAHRSSLMGPCRLCNCPMFVAHTHQVWNKNCKTCKHVH